MFRLHLQEKVFQALSAILNIPVVKYVHEYSGDYPLVVCKEISNVPSTHFDDQEFTRRVIYQISIGTTDDNYFELESLIETIMQNLGFMRVDSQDIFDDVYWRVIRFSIVEVKTNEQ